MDSLFRKLAIFDVFAVWVPGAIVLLCFLLTGAYFREFEILSILIEFKTDYSFLFIFVYSLAGYFVGIILHEIGKGLTDLMKPATWNYIIDCFKRDRVNVIYRLFINIHCIQKVANSEKRDNDLTVYDAMRFVEKENKETSFIKKSRALYGMSRSLFIGYTINSVFWMVLIMLNKEYILINLCIIALNFILSFILFCRALRYRFIWICNVFIEYDNLKS